MLTSVAQRWELGRSAFRPVGEPIRTADYDVASIPDDTTARSFVEQHHYSRSFPAARERVGLYRRGELVGVAVFSVPVNAKTLTVLPGDGVELGRFVLLDAVPSNGETWFLGRAFEYLRREGYAGVVSFADPFPRTTLGGAQVFAGHVGTIYQAHNACYLGRARRDTIRLLPDGRVFSSRAIQKIRKGERGWRYAAALLVDAGAPAPDGDLLAWLPGALAAVTRTVRHPGNHKYAWALASRDKRRLPASLPYPKFAQQHLFKAVG